MAPEELKKTEQNKDVLEIYKLLVGMADHVSQRRQSANSFYLTMNTAIIGGAAYLSNSAFGGLGTIAISAAGIAICFLWMRAMESYRSLNSAKFRVIKTLEARLPVSPFTEEWDILMGEEAQRKHKPFYKIEVWVPIVFMCVHAAQLLVHVPWREFILAAPASV